MINDFISNIIISFDSFLTSLGVYQKLTELISYLDDFQTYEAEFHKYLGAVYFIFGKPLVMYIVGIFVIVVIVRIVFAIVNIVGQYVP